ncbi:hypothetical protein H5410_034839 [Solanum commersonii]|uniref:Uncharacterized protein n=1 Tax=Solanum commersonii TaxID=4109 RepID=A0A9J5Y177_SOLCO|nr:hypothetical protein H5410_034839 [Solanum commersonii]
MPNPESSSKTPISQEVENPSSFNFSPPLFFTLRILWFFPTLVLFGNKSQILEAQSVVKPNVGPSSEEIDVGSMGLSSTISERLFEGDLPEGKCHESCILTAGAELVAVQSLDSLRGDVQPTFLEHEMESSNQEEEEISLKWSSKGMRGGNPSQLNVLELETIKGTFEIDIVGKPVEREKERQIKRKGNLVLSHSKGDKMKYVIRSETQKVMGSAIAARKAHTERTKKRRREGLEPEQPASTPLFIENNETESKDAVKYVAKRTREVGEERVKSKGNQKGGKKSPTKRVKVKIQLEERELTREERVEKMEQQRVFDLDTLTKFEPEVHEFFYKMELLEGGGITTTIRNVKILLDEETLGIILGVPVVGVQTIEGCNPTSDFSKLATKRGDVKHAGLPKKFLKGEY